LRAVIFANGLLANPAAEAARLRPDDWIIAADGGTRHALAAGVTPHVLIGDLDSVSPEGRARLESAGAEVRVYPSRKDETDLELALRHAVARACPAGDVDEILVLGALGGRWDQTLANVLLLAEPAFRACPVRLYDDRQSLFLAPSTFTGAPGDTVSLVPLRGDAHGVTTHGLEYPLANGTLRLGSTLGISNVMTAAEATVTVREGLVLIVHIEGVM